MSENSAQVSHVRRSRERRNPSLARFHHGLGSSPSRRRARLGGWIRGGLLYLHERPCYSHLHVPTTLYPRHPRRLTDSREPPGTCPISAQEPLSGVHLCLRCAPILCQDVHGLDAKRGVMEHFATIFRRAGPRPTCQVVDLGPPGRFDRRRRMMYTPLTRVGDPLGACLSRHACAKASWIAPRHLNNWIVEGTSLVLRV